MQRFCAIGLLAFSTQFPTAQSQKLAANPPTGLDLLFDKVWRITSPTPYANSGSIYIFLRNGTLLETSCGETYRIASWKPNQKRPDAVEVIEDGRVAFTATISAATGQSLHLRQTLALGDREVKELDLVAIHKEFVCPDMPR